MKPAKNNKLGTSLYLHFYIFIHVVHIWHGMLSCTTGFSSFHVTDIQLQRVCLRSPHINLIIPSSRILHS